MTSSTNSPRDEESKTEEVGNNKEKSLTISEKERTAAALSYVWILCLIPLFANRDSKFAQFHAKQGLILFGLETVGSLIFWFPLFGQVIALAFLIVSVLGAVKAYNGEWWKIPYIYDWSKVLSKK